MNNKEIIKTGFRFGLTCMLVFFMSCKGVKKNEEKPMTEDAAVMEIKAPFFKLSLAQWSMHKMIYDDGVDPYTFAKRAKGMGFEGLEYVSQLYKKELEPSNYSKEAMAAFVEKNNAESKKYGLVNLDIMIDGEGDLASADANERKKAVENHYKWVDAAAAMGCHSIRVNLTGSKNAEEWTTSAIDGLKQLTAYAKAKKLNVIVENHNGFSSNAPMLVHVIKEVGMDNCGTLPDFGNFCLRREDGSLYSSPCVEEYDRYKGIKELMPYAKAVSAKTYDFDAQGNETTIDYNRMLQIVKDAGYKGYIGVEYEGNRLSEEEGTMATKKLLLKVAKELN